MRNPYTTSDEVYALGQHICMSAHKARRIIDQIRGCSCEETLMILELMPYRACYPILKLVYSAAANPRCRHSILPGPRNKCKNKNNNPKKKTKSKVQSRITNIIWPDRNGPLLENI